MRVPAQEDDSFYRPVVMWFLNGPLGNSDTSAQITAFDEAGFGGVMPVPINNSSRLVRHFGPHNVEADYRSDAYFED